MLQNAYLVAKSELIQPRTSLSKFGGKFISLFIRLLKADSRQTSLKALAEKLLKVQRAYLTKHTVFSATVFRKCSAASLENVSNSSQKAF